MGNAAISAVKATNKQFKDNNIPYSIGITPMIGQNDIKS